MVTVPSFVHASDWLNDRTVSAPLILPSNVRCSLSMLHHFGGIMPRIAKNSVSKHPSEEKFLFDKVRFTIDGHDVVICDTFQYRSQIVRTEITL